MDTIVKTVPLSSLHKMFPNISPEEKAMSSFAGMKNEPISFQVVYKTMPGKGMNTAFYIKVISDLPITIYEEGYVPILQAINPLVQPESYQPGFFADMLLPKKTNPKVEIGAFPWEKLHFEKDNIQLHADLDSWKALWFTVNEDGKQVKPGKHVIKLELYNRRGNGLCGECEVTVDIIDALLPKQKLYYTN